MSEEGVIVQGGKAQRRINSPDHTHPSTYIHDDEVKNETNLDEIAAAAVHLLTVVKNSDDAPDATADDGAPPALLCLQLQVAAERSCPQQAGNKQAANRQRVCAFAQSRYTSELPSPCPLKCSSNVSGSP